MRARKVDLTQAEYAKTGRRSVCFTCGVVFRLPWDGKRKYCAAHVAEALARKADGSRLRRIGKSKYPKINCKHCHNEFQPQHANRRFCSYPCFVAYGGPIEAGAASKRAVKLYGAKKDANHGAIVGALESHGVKVLDLSYMGGGAPDLLVWAPWMESGPLLIEIKNPKTAYGRRGLNKLQKRFIAAGWPVKVVWTDEDALRAVAAHK